MLFRYCLKTANGWAHCHPKRRCTAIIRVVICLGNRAAKTYINRFSRPVKGDIGYAAVELPWRVAIVGSTLGPIVESSVVENLNPPCELTDVSWIKSGGAPGHILLKDNDHP